MEYRFRTKELEQWAKGEATEKSGFPPEIIKAFQKRMVAIDAAKDERDLHAVRGNRFERLKGKRAHQHSLRLNDQWRLIVELQEGNPQKIMLVVGIEDYH